MAVPIDPGSGSGGTVTPQPQTLTTIIDNALANTPGGIVSFGLPQAQKDQHVIMMLTDNGNADSMLTIEFDLNPENMQVQHPSRITTQQTVAGAYQDNWGAGVGRLQLSGNTGWRRKKHGGKDGYELYVALRDLHRRYQDLCADHDPELVNLQIILPPGDRTTMGNNGNGAGGLQFGMYRVSSDNFIATRNKNQPLLFSYQWDMTVIKDLMHASVDPSKRFNLQGTGSPTDPLATALVPGQTSGPTGQGTTTGSTSFPDNSTDPNVQNIANNVANVASNIGNSIAANNAAADAATAAEQANSDTIPVEVPTPIYPAEGVTLAELASSNNVSATAIQNYAVTHTYDVPPSIGPLSPSTPVYLPTQVWMNVYTQRMGS